MIKLFLGKLYRVKKARGKANVTKTKSQSNQSNQKRVTALKFGVAVALKRYNV